VFVRIVFFIKENLLLCIVEAQQEYHTLKLYFLLAATPRIIFCNEKKFKILFWDVTQCSLVKDWCSNVADVPYFQTRRVITTMPFAHPLRVYAFLRIGLI